MPTPAELTVRHDEGPDSIVLRWEADQPRALVHILHGWAEHARRYDRLAQALVAAGYTVVADDHRGHGQSGLRSDSLGDLGPRGMDGVLDAVHEVTRVAATQVPDVAIFVLGHSWGSFLLQRYLRRWSDEIDGAVLTGTTYRDPDAAPDPDRPGPNAGFEPARTPYDWLSRDEAEVDLYVADPLCGFDIMRDSPRTRSGDRAAGSPATTPGPRRELPILILNGSDDPVGGAEGGQALAEHYRGLGVVDVAFSSYDGARHELFNEINRDQVTADLIAWLDAHGTSR